MERLRIKCENGYVLLDDRLMLYTGKDKSIVLPNEVKIVSREAFYGSTVEIVDTGDSVVQICSGAFSNCNEIKKIIIRESVIEIEPNSLPMNENISIEIRKNNSRYEFKDDALIDRSGSQIIWVNKSVKVFVFPNEIRSIGNAAFEGCAELTKVYLNSQIEEIPDKCFVGCKKLRFIRWNNRITSIGDYAFQYCASLLTEIPKSVLKIGYLAFFGCKNMTEYKIYAEGMNCFEMAYINVNLDNHIFLSENIVYLKLETTVNQNCKFYITNENQEKYMKINRIPYQWWK